tara:strand:+ start:1231 stop:1449 length:219 start_codon:yes stop_codon:yes gene_type:complete
LKTLLLILALALTGCSALEQKLAYPPHMIKDKYPVTVCEPTESLLFCEDSTHSRCVGYLEDKPITTLEETEL